MRARRLGRLALPLVGLAFVACAHTLAAPPAALLPAGEGPAVPRLRTILDSSGGTFVLVAGPFTIAPSSASMMRSMTGPEDDSLLTRVTWPVDAWVRGFTLRLSDAAGNPLRPRPLHHFNVVNFDRRELFYPLVQKLMSFSKETEDVALPATAVSPLAAGQHLGFYVMWANGTDQPITGVYLTLTMTWTRARRGASPLLVFPFFVDVHHVVLGFDTFDVPPGGCTMTAEFSVPVDGHLLAAGGHLHDHGVSLELDDATTHRTLLTLHAERDRRGTVLGVSRKLPGALGPGLPLRTDHRYRLIAVYDNPTPDTVRAAMGLLAGLFMPDDARSWPAVDPSNAEWRLDLARLGFGEPAPHPE